jgi:hypothetical protein
MRAIVLALILFASIAAPASATGQIKPTPTPVATSKPTKTAVPPATATPVPLPPEATPVQPPTQPQPPASSAPPAPGGSRGAPYCHVEYDAQGNVRMEVRWTTDTTLPGPRPLESGDCEQPATPTTQPTPTTTPTMPPATATPTLVPTSAPQPTATATPSPAPAVRVCADDEAGCMPPHIEAAPPEQAPEVPMPPVQIPLALPEAGDGTCANGCLVP